MGRGFIVKGVGEKVEKNEAGRYGRVKNKKCRMRCKRKEGVVVRERKKEDEEGQDEKDGKNKE